MNKMTKEDARMILIIAQRGSNEEAAELFEPINNLPQTLIEIAEVAELDAEKEECFSEKEIYDFAREAIPVSDQTKIAIHITTCDACRATYNAQAPAAEKDLEDWIDSLKPLLRCKQHQKILNWQSEKK